jgi:hypothetical protein
MQQLILCEGFVPAFSPGRAVGLQEAPSRARLPTGTMTWSKELMLAICILTANITNHVDQSTLERQDDQVDARFDWIPSEMDSLLARFLLGNSDQRFRPVCRTSDSIVGVGLL